MSTTWLNALAGEFDKLVAPLATAAEDPYSLEQLLAELGATSSAAITAAERDALSAAFTAILDLKSRIEELANQDSPSLESIGVSLGLFRQAFAAVRGLQGLDGSAGAFAELGEDLCGYLVAMYLRCCHPLAHSVGVLTTLIERAEEREARPPVLQNGTLVRDFFPVDRFHFKRLVDLVQDPVATLRTEYSTSLATVDEANQLAQKLFPRLAYLLRNLHVSYSPGSDPDDAELLGDAAPFVQNSLIVYVDDPLAGAPAEAGVVLSLSPAGQGDLGLVISPFGTLTTTKTFGGWKIDLSCTAGVDLFAYGRHGFTLLADASTTEVKGSISATLPAPEQGPAFVLGAANGTRLEIGGAQIKLETSLSEAQQSLAVSADVSKSAVVIAPPDDDGFLSRILPAEGVRTHFDLGIAWSNTHGLRLRGSAGLETTIPIGRSFAGVKLSTLHLSLQAKDAHLYAEVSAGLSASIGPVQASIERIGLAAALAFPDSGANLGFADLDFRFKPPNGLGLAIEATVVLGGGYLSFDPQKGEYSGILQLAIAEKISVKAIGLLTTRMPDGTKGYSLVVIIFVEGFAPIQLGFGFALTGIGGLLGINRTFNEEALRAGLKNHTLDSVMFPQDPIRNAPQILSNLNRVFPPANGHHLFGPMVQIAWGTPALITADVGVVLEFGARLRLLILAQVVAILPKRENDLVRLQMDAIGVLDFDQGTAALDATLYDSRLLKKFVLTGDMAMRLKWEGSPNFALAIGGLHPAFNPPTNFPKLERIAISLSAGDNPRIRCESYFALTANTVQFGARAELYAAASGFSIQGEIGYDVLIQFDPFYFLADFYAQLQLKRGSTNLFKVRLEGALGGPRPLHLKGKATFEVLWMDVSIRFDKTLVEGEKPPPPEPIDVLPRLKEALGNPGNWISRLPDGQRPVVTLRATQGAATEVLLHPLGTLTVKQGIVPLNLNISRFGQAAPAGVRRFTISSVSLGGQNQAVQSVKDFFAPAQFFEMSDDEKLSRPSFEPMAAGVSIGSDEFAFSADAGDWLEVEAIKFETITINRQKNESRRSAPEELYELSKELLGKQALFGAAGVSDLRRTGKAKYRTTMGKHRIAKEGWSIVATDDMTVRPAPGLEDGKPTIYSEAAQALQRLKQQDPTKAAGLKILRLSELVEV